VIITPFAFCNVLVCSSYKYYFESTTLSSFACHCLTVKFLLNRFECRLPISCSFAVTSSKLTINWKQSKYIWAWRTNSHCQVEPLVSAKFQETGLHCTPNPRAYKLEKGVICKKANNLGKGLFYYQLSSSISLYIYIIHSSRKAYTQLCMSTLALQYVLSYKYL